MTYNFILLMIYAILIVLMSFITFILFGKDKNIAKKQNGKMRIKEKTLLGLTVLNGAIGALIGRIVFHHKTDKKYFSITIYMSLLFQIFVLITLCLLAFEIL